MSDLMVSGIIVGLFALMFWTPALMSIGVAKFEGDVSIGEKLLCCIPIYNVMRAEKKYYGKPRLVTISTLLLVVITIARVLIWWFMYSNVTLGTISIIAFWIAIALWCVSNMIFVYTIIHDADVMHGVKLLLCAIAFPFGQYYIGNYLTNVIRHMNKQEETFKG